MAGLPSREQSMTGTSVAAAAHATAPVIMNTALDILRWW